MRGPEVHLRPYFVDLRKIMYVSALSTGCAVPSVFDASVHSVFQSSINLRLSNVNRLITLIVSSEGDLPQGIRLDASEGFTFEKFQIGEEAVCRGDILHLDNPSLTIQLHGARRYRCDLPALMMDGSNPAILVAWSSVWQTLNKRQRLSKAEIIAEEIFHSSESARGVVLRKAGEAMRSLVRATQKYEFTDTTAIRALIGLGPGLTPSGDDLLVGFMAGLWCIPRNRERMKFISTLGKAILCSARKTNDISRTYLAHAVRGQVSSRLANLAEAICHAENSGPLLDIAETAMRVGHTSGMDAVTGLLIGLTVWDGNHLFSK